MVADFFGYAATIVGICIFLPQIYRSYTTKHVRDLAWGMVILFFLNCLLWLIYGLFITSVPLIIANALGLLESIAQLTLKIMYNRDAS